MKRYILTIILLLSVVSTAYAAKLKCKNFDDCSTKAEAMYRRGGCCVEWINDGKKCFMCRQKNIDNKVFIYWKQTWEQ